MRILLLEDNATDANLTKHVFQNDLPGCEIEHAETLQKAREFLAGEKSFDVALLDMQLPDGNGMDILMEIRQKEMDMAVAILTGSGDEEVAAAALKAGADDYMVKQPGYVYKIHQLVEFAIENHKSSRRRDSNFIQVLHIEHNAADIDLMSRYFTRYAPYIQIKNVAAGEEALKILPDKETNPAKWDYQVILMDFRLPGMNALEVIKELRQERKLDIPVIIVTGQGNEEVAVQALKMGANEYLVKRDNYLTRLPSLISGVYEHCELKRKQIALTESEAKYRLLAENSGDVIFTLDFGLNYTYISPAIYALRGYRPEEIINRNISQTIAPASGKKVKQLFEKYIPAIKNGNVIPEPFIVELEVLKKDGSTIWIEVKLSVLIDSKGKPAGVLGVSRDISKRKAAQNELRKLSRAVVQSPVSIVITDKDGKIEYVNPKFTQITGYNLEEAIGQNPRILNSGEQPQYFYKELWNTILAGNDWYGEFRNKKKNGELYWESASISSLTNDEGEITHLVAVKEDISQRKKMEQIQKILFNISVAVVTSRNLDDFFNLIYSELTTVINTKNLFVALYNESEESFSTLFMFDTVDEIIVDFPAKNTLAEYVIKKRKSQFIDRILHDELLEKGEIEIVDTPSEVWIGVPIFDDAKAIGVMVIKNYEGEKNLTEEDLKILEYAAPAINLAIERKRFIEDLKIEKDKAQAADRLKTAFLNNIAHEVRTPLNGILGFTSLFCEPNFSLAANEEYFKIIQESGERLLNTVEDIIEISKIETTQSTLTISKFNISDHLNAVTKFFEPEYKRKNLVLFIEDNLQVHEKIIYTDSSKVKAVITNLLKNAIKFTHNGQISVSLHKTEDLLILTVKDTGIGIPHDKLEVIFDRFVQAEMGLTRAYEGSGLGLSIAKSYTTLLGGSLSVNSELGKGSTFYFSIPCNNNNQLTLKENRTPLSIDIPMNLKILIVDDDYPTIVLLNLIFKNKCKELFFARNGIEAISKMEENPDIKLILMDLKMPGMDGYEASLKLKQLNNNIKIIAQTAYALMGDKEKALAAGCDAYITKPINRKKLFSLINKCFS